MNYQLYYTFGRDLIVMSVPAKGGYLNFLPQKYHYTCSEGVQYSFFETDHMVIVELKGDVDVYKGKIMLRMEHIVFWQVYQFLNQSCPGISQSQLIVDQKSILFTSKEGEVSLQMAHGKQWLWAVGYKKESVDFIMAEYGGAMMKIRSFLEDDSLKDWISPDFTIGHRFRDVFGQIEGFSYKPLRSRLEVGMVLCRLLDLTFVQLNKLDTKEEYSKLKTYYAAIEYVRNNFTSNITRETVADALGMSVRTLQRAFEGRAVKLAEFIFSLRMNRAKELLLTEDWGVKDVSTELHFPDVKYFSKEFKKLFAKPPSAFVAIGKEIGLRGNTDLDEEE